MQIDTWILIVGGFAVMFFGYFFGLIEGRGQGYNKRQAEEKTKEKAGEVPTQPAAPAAPPPAPPAAQAERPSILNLREEAGRLQLELDGKELDDQNLLPDQRRRLVEAVTRLRPWVEAPVKASTPAPVAATPIPPVSPPVAVPPVPVSPPAEEPAANSMVRQISDILEQMVEGTALAGRGIKLLEEPGGGVTVVVGEARYASIGDVTEPEIQAALRAAIARWEKKYTPGL